MRAVLVTLVTATLAVATALAFAHVAIEIEIVSPAEGERLPGGEVMILLRGASPSGLRGTTQVQVQIDGLFLAPGGGGLSPEPPAFGGTTVSTDETVTLLAPDLDDGEHVLRIEYSPHPADLEPVSQTRRFLVGEDDSGLPLGLIVVAAGAAAAVAAGLLLARRRRA